MSESDDMREGRVLGFARCFHNSTQLILGDDPVEVCLICGASWWPVGDKSKGQR